MDEPRVAPQAAVMKAFSNIIEAETNGETTWDVSVALKAIRTKDARLRGSLLQSREYYRLLYLRGITDGFQSRLLEEEGQEGMTSVGDFLSLWKGSLPGRFEEVIKDRDLVRLREAFDYINAERLEAVEAEKVNVAFKENVQFKAILSTSDGLKPLLFQPLEEIVGSREKGKLVVFADFLWFCSLHLPHVKQRYTLGPVAEKILRLPKKDLKWGIPSCRAVTHAQIQQLADILEVNSQEEVKLLWVLKHALETPPPPGSSPQATLEDEDEREIDRGLNAAKKHVAYDYICDLLEYERQSLRIEDTGVDSQVWMKFEFPHCKEQDRCVYYYNFATREISGEHPVKRNEKLMEDENGLIHAPLAKTFELNQLRKKKVFGYSTKRPGRGKGTTKRGNQHWKLLVFKAWWTEVIPTLTERPSRRRYVEVCFHIHSGSCQLRIDGSANLYTLSHLNGRHEPIESWDLFVGRKVNLLGRQTTLMQADLSTQQWNYYYFQKINALRHRAMTELSKYDASAGGAKFQRKLQVGNTVKNTSPACDGSINLRAYMNDTQLLVAELEKYRPQIAKKLLRDLLSLLQDDKSPRLEQQKHLAIES